MGHIRLAIAGAVLIAAPALAAPPAAGTSTVAPGVVRFDSRIVPPSINSLPEDWVPPARPVTVVPQETYSLAIGDVAGRRSTRINARVSERRKSNITERFTKRINGDNDNGDSSGFPPDPWAQLEYRQKSYER